MSDQMPQGDHDIDGGDNADRDGNRDDRDFGGDGDRDKDGGAEATMEMIRASGGDFRRFARELGIQADDINVAWRSLRCLAERYAAKTCQQARACSSQVRDAPLTEALVQDVALGKWPV